MVEPITGEERFPQRAVQRVAILGKESNAVARWRKKRAARLFAALSVLASVSMLVMAMGQFTSQQVGVAEGRNLLISTSSQDALPRLHPVLVDQMNATPDANILVHAYVVEGADLSRYMADGLQRSWSSPDGITIITGTVRGRNLIKLASAPGVLSIEPLTGAYAPAGATADGNDSSVQPDAEMRAAMTAQIQSGQRNNIASASDGGFDAAPTGWYDVLNTHHAVEAWEMGYTGQGVKVMANDSGIDFANADLIGTWATVDDPDSPYYGWPMQFDAYSMFLHARDVILGESNIISGAGHYADTSAVVTEGDASYQPLDSDETRSYTLTGTSQSGDYHIGTHPDTSLRPWYWIATGQEPPEEDAPGERPAILVVDEAEVGVYDTVYVDLDFDNDFSDEKPMTKEDPIAGADWWGPFDPATGTNDPEPDGLYDISAGMVYWISDNVNPVPAADWWWGFGTPGNGEHDSGEPGAGSMVLFAVNDYMQSPAGNHGQLVASAIAAQGVIDGDSMQRTLSEPGSLDWQTGGVSPDYKPADAGGVVQAAGKDVKLVSAGDFYSYGGADAFVFAALGYDGFPGTIDDVQIINNSWGSSADHNDG